MLPFPDGAVQVGDGRTRLSPTRGPIPSYSQLVSDPLLWRPSSPRASHIGAVSSTNKSSPSTQALSKRRLFVAGFSLSRADTLMSERGHCTKSLRSSPLRGARGERPVAASPCRSRTSRHRRRGHPCRIQGARRRAAGQGRRADRSATQSEQPAHRLLPSRSKLSTPLISAARAECVHVRMENEL